MFPVPDAMSSTIVEILKLLYPLILAKDNDSFEIQQVVEVLMLRYLIPMLRNMLEKD